MNKEREKKEMSKIKFKIGADPEFEIRDGDGNCIGADRYFQSSGILGCDGVSSTGEIRPKPAWSAHGVEKQLNDIIREMAKTIPLGFEVYAGSGLNVPLGGHIHFGRRVPREGMLLKYLDFFITDPLNVVSNRRRRQRSGYGEAGETQKADHGGWEYRSPCSWLAHPIIARRVMYIARAIARAHMEGKLTGNMKPIEWYRGEKTASRKHIRSFYHLLRRMKKKRQTLEQVKVFKAWRKKRTKGKTNLNIRFNLEDLGMERVQKAFEEIKPDWITIAESRQSCLGITGANESRTQSPSIDSLQERHPADQRIAEGKIIFVSNNNHLGRLPRGAVTWELGGIGLSVRLRYNATECAVYLLEILRKYYERGIGVQSKVVVEG